jgi:GNAT superfamily N-acetyltransferase
LPAGPPPLDTPLGALPAGAGCWHIHDIALAPAARGRGHATAVLHALLRDAATAGYAVASLVAIAGQRARWAGFGFCPAIPADAAALASYGAGATWMLRG